MNIMGILQRLFVRKAVNWGIRKGTDAIAARSGGSTAASKAQSKQARAAIKRARQAARLTRRIGR